MIVYFLSDIFWGMLYGQRLITLAYVDTVIYFLVMVVSVLLWTRFVVAYLEKLKDMEIHVDAGMLKEFAVAVFDLNDLKKVNDTLGHEAGDQYVKDSCKFICQRFKYSPVFRIGGDEFVVILEGIDYEDREEILKGFEEDIDRISEGKGVKRGEVILSREWL